METDEIRFMRKDFIQERRRDFRKSGRLSSCESTLKIPHHFVQLFGNSEMNSQCGNEIQHTVGIDSTCVGFFKGKTKFPPFSLKSRQCIRTGIIAQLPTSRTVHCAVANIAERS
jgi:hypothetical protein